MENYLGSGSLQALQDQDITFIDLRLDYAFKLVFGKKGNEDLLLKLVDSILPERHITNVILNNPEQEGLRPTSRNAVFDISCQTSDGEEIIIEMQYKSQDDFNQRMVFYSSFPIQNNTPKGKNKDGVQLNFSFPPVYMIAITNFIIPRVKKNPDLINEYIISNKKDITQVLTDTVTYVTVELPKFTKQLEDLQTTGDLLLYAIKNIGSLKEMPEEYIGSGLEKLFELCRFASMMTAEQRQYLAEYMAKLDEGSRLASAWNHGVEEGEAKGREEGRAEAAMEYAKKLKKLGVKDDIIFQATGISEDQLASL